MMRAKGDKALLVEMPIVEVEGETYTFRRLGYEDCITVASILKEATSSTGVDLVGLAQSGDTGRQFQALLEMALTTLSDSGKAIIDFIGRTLRKDDGELLGIVDVRNPEIMPIGSLFPVLQALYTHPDLADFFTQVGTMMGLRESIPTPPSNKPSISSSPDTDGQTSKS